MVGMRTETSPRVSETYWPGSRVLHMPLGTPGSPLGRHGPGAYRLDDQAWISRQLCLGRREANKINGEERLRPQRAKGTVQAQPQRPRPFQSDPQVADNYNSRNPVLA